MTIRNVVASLGMLSLMTMSAAGQPRIGRTPAVHTSAADAKEMFSTYCAVCHGTSGKGDGPAASAFKKAPADLTQLAAKNGGKFPQAQVIQYISGADTVAAHGTRDMPIWGNVFHSIDADPNVALLRYTNLAAYIRTLQTN